MKEPEGPNAHLEAIDALRAWNYLLTNGAEIGGLDCPIGVLEPGALVNEHADLFFSDEANGIKDISPGKVATPNDSHATHVTGIRRAEHNEFGALGVLSAKKILFNSTKEGRWLSGIEDTWWTSWAVDFDGYEGEDSLIDDGAAIINQSFGQNTFKYHKEGVQYC